MYQIAWLLGVAVALAALGCPPPPATEADCQAACEKHTNLQSPAQPAPAEDPEAKVEDEFGNKIDEAMKAKESAIKAINDELAARVAAVTKDEDRARLDSEYGAKRAAKEAELNPPIDELVKQKEAALEAARAAKARAKADAAGTHDNAVKACVNACLAAKTAKPTTDCRQNAMSLDEYNGCK